MKEFIKDMFNLKKRYEAKNAACKRYCGHKYLGAHPERAPCFKYCDKKWPVDDKSNQPLSKEEFQKVKCSLIAEVGSKINSVRKQVGKNIAALLTKVYKTLQAGLETLLMVPRYSYEAAKGWIIDQILALINSAINPN